MIKSCRIIQLIKQADQFGAAFQPTIKLGATKYKSIQGGMFSIIIYGLSFAYFIYGIHQWASDQILPNITEFKEVAEILDYKSTTTKLSFTPFLFPEQIDPFESSNIILMAVIQQIDNGIANTNMRRLYLKNGWIQVDDIDFKKDKMNQNFQETLIFLTQCIPQLLDLGEQCASDTIMKKFWAQTNIMNYRLHSEQYNFRTRQLQEISKQYFVLYRQDASYINYIQLQKAKSYVDEGFLFPSIREYDFVSDISSQLQSITIEQGVVLYKLNIFLYFNIRMDIVFQVQNIAYANISSVLANIGSIVSLLLFFQYIAILINQRRFQEYAKFYIIKMFYPEFKHIIIKKNWFGKVKSIENLQTKYVYDVEQFKQYYDKLSQVAEQKLCMSNLIFELSRLQFAIQQLLSKEELIKLRDKHLQISLQKQELLQKDLGKIRQSSFNQIQPSSNEEILYEKEEDLQQAENQIQQSKEIDVDQLEIQSEISDFELFCQQIHNFLIYPSNQLKLKTQQYKTIYGGIISIIIYGLSFAYFAYGIHQWATNQILPNIVDFKVVNEVVSYQSEEKILSIESSSSDGMIDPFDKSNLILLVLIQEYQNDLPNSNLARIKQTDSQFYVQNLSLINDNSNQNNKEIFIYITPCIEEYLNSDEQCASQNLIQQYWDQSNYLLLTLYLQQYNTKSRQLKQLSKLFYISYGQDQTYINNLYLQQTQTITDQGLLFPDVQQYNFISDIFQQSQSISLESGFKLLGIPSYICMPMRIDTLQLEQNIAFANISNVLANIGSIVSSLLFLSYIAILINQKYLDDEAIFDVIRMFYPDFNDLIIKKNWSGRIKSIYNHKTNLYYEVEEYKQYYERLAYVAEQKLCMSNLIYEVSRLQFAIQQLVARDDLIPLRDKHYKISLKAQKMKQKDLARIKQPSFSQIQPSIDRDSKIIEIFEIKEEDLESSVQQIGVNNILQSRQDFQNDLQEEDFDIFCQNRYQQKDN